MERPVLDKNSDSKTFRDFYYLKEELVEFCRENGLPTSGGKSVIDKQFEYNTYTRDFFADNKGKSLEEAIKCWKYKKQLQGHNRYERSDLVALD